MAGLSQRRGLIAFAVATASLVTLTAACSLLTDLSDLRDGAATDAAGDRAPQPSATDAEAGSSDADVIDGARIDAGPDGSYASVVLADAPVAYLRLGEPSGSVANDATGHGNAGALGTGHTFGVPGAIASDPDTALHLDGVTSGVVLGKKFDFAGAQAYSLEAWAKIDLVDLEFRHLFKKSARPAAGREAYGVFVQDGFLTYERIVAGTQLQVGVATAPLVGRWIHVVTTYDNSLMRMYVDGLEVKSFADARPAGAIDADAFVGCNDALDAYVFGGDLDEIAIYDTALPADRVKAHFDTGKGTR